MQAKFAMIVLTNNKITDQMAEWYGASASGSVDLGFDSESGQTNDFKIGIHSFPGPTKHRKELQGTENSAKNYKVLQGTTRYFKRSTKWLKTLQGTTRYF